MQDHIQRILDTLQRFHLHPFVDHFSVAIIVVAILTDLAASLFSSRQWLRYMALTLIIVGAGAVALSNLTGGWDANRAWDAIKAAGGPTLATFKQHARIGDILPWVFAVLAVWRLVVQAFGFAAGSRPLYLIVAIAAGAAILYQGYLGGELVYRYGVGTALLSATQAAPPAVPSIPTPMATVYVPPPQPMATPSPEATGAPTPVPMPLPTESPVAAAPVPAPTAAAPPVPAPGATESGGTTITPPGTTPPDARATL